MAEQQLQLRFPWLKSNILSTTPNVVLECTISAVYQCTILTHIWCKKEPVKHTGGGWSNTTQIQHALLAKCPTTKANALQTQFSQTSKTMFLKIRIRGHALHAESIRLNFWHVPGNRAQTRFLLEMYRRGAGPSNLALRQPSIPLRLQIQNLHLLLINSGISLGTASNLV